MRAVVVVSLLALLWPASTWAQNAAPKTPAKSDGITKSEYVEKARERAVKRFEKLDANHDGVLSADERRAARRKRRETQ